MPINDFFKSQNEYFVTNKKNPY